MDKQMFVPRTYRKVTPLFTFIGKNLHNTVPVHFSQLAAITDLSLQGWT